MISWYLFISKGPSDKVREPLGEVAAVTKHLDSAFPGLEWKSAKTAACPEKDFSLELGVLKGSVFSVTIRAGRMPLKGLAETCKQQRWRLEDADVGADIDLNDPEAWFYAHHG